jgi:hypothetical protein
VPNVRAEAHAELPGIGREQRPAGCGQARRHGSAPHSAAIIAVAGLLASPPADSLIYIKDRAVPSQRMLDMEKPDNSRRDERKPPKPSGREEAHERMIEEYADDLRETIKWLRRKLN